MLSIFLNKRLTKFQIIIITNYYY